jgi:hypothetical protein
MIALYDGKIQYLYQHFTATCLYGYYSIAPSIKSNSGNTPYKTDETATGDIEDTAETADMALPSVSI